MMWTMTNEEISLKLTAIARTVLEGQLLAQELIEGIPDLVKEERDEIIKFVTQELEFDEEFRRFDTRNLINFLRS